jgi:hypothetical protein
VAVFAGSDIGLWVIACLAFAEFDIPWGWVRGWCLGFVESALTDAFVCADRIYRVC